MALTVPTLVGPVRGGDREAQQHNQNRVSGRASRWPQWSNSKLERPLNSEGNGENEGSKVVIAEVSSAVDQTDCGGGGFLVVRIGGHTGDDWEETVFPIPGEVRCVSELWDWEWGEGGRVNEASPATEEGATVERFLSGQ